MKFFRQLQITSAWITMAICLACFAGEVRGDEPAGGDANDNVDAARFNRTLQPFLKQYCISCHGPDEANGDRRFDTLTSKIDSAAQLTNFREMLEQLAAEEMPPEDARQPTSAERKRVVAWLRQSVDAAAERIDVQPAPHVTLRRLNAREYHHTIRDLLKLNTTIFDPTREFPQDQRYEHLDTIGERLVTSGYLLARYLDAAEASINQALSPRTKPAVQTWTFRGGFRQQPEVDQVHRRVNGFSRLTLYEVRGADKHEGAYAPLLRFRDGVPHSGYYEIRYKAQAVNRKHPYDVEFVGTDPNEKLRLGIVPGNAQVGALHKPQPVEPLLAEQDLEDEPQWYTARVWLDQGYTPRFVFLNGMIDARTMWNRIVRKYPKQFPPRKRPGIVEARFYAIQYSKLPQIHIDEVEIKGPFYDNWPTASQHALLGQHADAVLSGKSLRKAEWRALVKAFLRRAYRGPVTETEVDRVMQLMAARYKQHHSQLQAFADGLIAALCSPRFLYLDTAAHHDGSSNARTRLSSHALASRLSYFLWASMPDDRLLRLADEDALQDRDVLAREVERMLNDPKSDAFVNGFLDSWLTLRDLGSMPPDRNRFKQYYHYDLKTAMRRETFLFTRYLLDENLSVTNFLDSDFTFVNRPLAKLYGIEPPTGREFAKVAINDRRRGGLLGQASVLTVTANGIDTSPVIRGVWLLENLLGTPPSPPPANVEPLDPDVRGTKTIREQLAKHRSSDSCNACHRTIDPPGFALENFDAIGQWRNNYAKRIPVDASAELPSGQKFRNVVEFKRILLKSQQEKFARALTGKLLAYSVGRPIESDDPEVAQLVGKLKQRGNGLRDLVKLVVQSEAFRSTASR